MKRVTLDTNVFPADDVKSLCRQLGWSIAVVTVTARESEQCDFNISIEPLETIPEGGVWGESRWGEALWGSDETEADFERILAIISNRSFPRDRNTLSPGHRRQLRDAMILQAHVREGRDVFVSNDYHAFIQGGRREQLESEFGTRIMSRDEFIKWMRELLSSRSGPDDA